MCEKINIEKKQEGIITGTLTSFRKTDQLNKSNSYDQLKKRMSLSIWDKTILLV